jgi:Domain of Unknown Function (DUF1080)
MSTRRGRTKVLLIAAFGAVACCALAASAYGFVQVYSNNFNNKPQYRSVKTVTSGNHCKRKFKESRKAMEVMTTDGPRHCRFKPNAQGSAPQPNQRFDAVGRILTKTASHLRPDAYMSMSIRVGGGERYELRIFPKDRDYELRRKPPGAMFPSAGSNNAIKPIGEANRMRLQVDGARVRAFVNGTQLADVTDPSPGELRGAKVEFGVGSLKNTRQPTVAMFDKLKLSIPTP